MLRGREFRPEKRIWRKKIMADRIVLNTIPTMATVPLRTSFLN